MNNNVKPKKTNYGGYIVAGLAGLGILYIILSMFGATKSFFGWDAAHTGAGWTVVAVIFLVLTALIAITLARDPEKVHTWSIVSLLVCFILAIGFSTGFKFTAGDVAQRITFLDAEGRVADKKVLYQYYTDFYNLDKDTALRNYVEKYNELPGRNLHNFYILDKKIPRSTAPRADEPDFKWHTTGDAELFNK